ncbi:MAG TPA: hypothetical protein VFS58_17340 [Steroidobacteraceae bacterium]|nr:hypothetical protein [Steroidobacteraceae bacterium]
MKATVLVLVVSSLCAGAAQGRASIDTWWAHQFTDSVGVNTHLRHARSFYDSGFELMKQRLLAARITHIRDGAMDQDGGFFARDRAERFRELGEAGIRVTFIFRPMVTREFVQGFPERVRPAFEAYELPNELNQQKSMPWAESLRVWMPLFAQYVRGNREALQYPIIGPSIADLGGDPHRLLGERADEVDFGNLHKYYRSYNPATAGYGRPGSPPCDAWRYGALPYALCQVRRISADKPIVCTEAGYATNGPSTRAVTPEIQARYIARMLMLHLKAGIVRTFVYQLADHGSDEGATMGLLDASGGEKPAWRQLSALMHELDDEAGQGKARPIDIALDGELENLEAMLFAKRDGSYRLVLWLEAAAIDPKAGRVLEVAPQQVALTLPGKFRARRLLTFVPSGESNVRVLSGATLRLSIGDNLSIVDIGL